MRRCIFLYLVIMASMLSSHAFAGVQGFVPTAKDWSPVVSLSAGPIWAGDGDTQTFFLASEIEKTYVARKSINKLGTGELFFGMQKSLSSQWLGQLGLAAAITENATFQGVIWDDADPEFDNHSYQYKVRNTRIAVKGKLIFDKGYWLTPWVSGSAGLGFNYAHDFTNTPLIEEALPNPNFTHQTKTDLTYTLGVGVQKKLNQHWQFGIGFEFADWGKSELGRAYGQTQNSGLALNHLYTKGVLFNFTYVA